MDPDESATSEKGVASIDLPLALPSDQESVAPSGKQTPADLSFHEDNETTTNIRSGSFKSPRGNNTLSLDTASGRIEKVNPLLFVAAFGLCAVFLILCGRKRKFGWSQSETVTTSKGPNVEEEKSKGQYTRIDNAAGEDDDKNEWDEWDGEEPKERSENSEYGLPGSPPRSIRALSDGVQLKPATIASTLQDQPRHTEQLDESVISEGPGSPSESVQQKHDVFSVSFKLMFRCAATDMICRHVIYFVGIWYGSRNKAFSSSTPVSATMYKWLHVQDTDKRGFLRRID